MLILQEKYSKYSLSSVVYYDIFISFVHLDMGAQSQYVFFIMGWSEKKLDINWCRNGNGERPYPFV